MRWHLLGFSGGQALNFSAPCSRPGISLLACVVTRKCRANGQACASYHGTPLPVLLRICLGAAARAGGFLSVPPGRDTRPKQSIVSRFPCERDDIRVRAKAERGRGTGLDEQNSHLGRWPPLHRGDRLSGPPPDLHLGIGIQCGCTSLPPPSRRTRRAIMRSSRRLLSRSPRGLMCTNSSGARVSFSFWCQYGLACGSTRDA